MCFALLTATMRLFLVLLIGGIAVALINARCRARR
jgi:hypothetical protein